MARSETTGAGLTERQAKWFATVEANLEKNTGKPLADWLAVMKACPETKPRAQMAWLKTHHGVGQNSAAFILDATNPSAAGGWDDAEALRAALWKDPSAEAILKAVEALAGGVDGVISGQRKGYTAFSRKVQFAAIRPMKGGKALLGLKLDPSVSPRLEASARKESWSERLVSVVALDDPGRVDTELANLFEQAAANG
jgi:hypothetical protein